MHIIHNYIAAAGNIRDEIFFLILDAFIKLNE